VAVVCGAGINCVGVGPDGSRVRFPALGAITGDWGGGYDVGSAALFVAARSEDGSGKYTSLEQAVPRHFGGGGAAVGVALARVALTRLGLESEPVEVVLGGGLLRAGDDRLEAAIIAGLAQVGPAITVHTTDAPPVVGAALLGLDRLGADDRAKERARRQLIAAVDADDDLESPRPVGMEARRG
jgi:hypothetical protein